MMAAVAWRSLLPVIMISIFMVYEDWVSFPSCKLLPSTTYSPDKHVENVDDSLEDLKVMMVANLLLLGSEAGFVNLYFRDYYMSKFFKVKFSFCNLCLLLSYALSESDVNYWNNDLGSLNSFGKWDILFWNMTWPYWIGGVKLPLMINNIHSRVEIYRDSEMPVYLGSF